MKSKTPGLVLLTAVGILASSLAAPTAMAITKDVTLRLVGASSAAQPILDTETYEQPHFLSSARGMEHSFDVSGYSPMGAFKDVYPGIDVFNYADSHHYEFVFRIQNGGDPSQIRLQLEDTTIAGMSERGDVVYEGDGFEAYQHDPIAYSQSDDDPRRQVPGHLSLAGGDTTGITVQDFFSRNTEEMNGNRFNLVPAGGWNEGPDYDFYMSKYELSNHQFIDFLNDAERHQKDPRGANMFIDKQGSIWINPEMRPQQDELFNIDRSKIIYDENKAIGHRYQHKLDENEEAYHRFHPVVGLSWYGGVKYCNWLTLHSGRGLAAMCYTEGTNAVDWAPVTATNWAAGKFSAMEREQWTKLKGFRLPMQRLDDESSSTNAYNEFVKAASWNGTTNTTFGYGRDDFRIEDANARPTALAMDEETLPVGYFDGDNNLKESKTRENYNRSRIYDLTGNVSEWGNDPARSGLADSRRVMGGSYEELPQSVEKERIVLPYACESFCGVRPMTTYMPEESTYVNVLYCFHTTGELPEDITSSFHPGRGGGDAWDDIEPQIITPGDMPKSEEGPDSEWDDPERPDGIYVIPGDDDDQGEDEDDQGEDEDPDVTRSNLVLRVTSENPDSGVYVQINRSDVNGSSDGNTTFTRTYQVGDSVTLTAPPNVGGRVFRHWLVNGVITSTDPTLSIVLYDDTTVTAVYADPVVLAVRSRNPNSGVNIIVTGTDIYGNTHGYTSFDRTYAEGAVVTLEAPPVAANGNSFVGWERNGSLITTSSSVDVTMNSSTEMTAVYEEITKDLFVRSQHPNSGVGINLDITDVNGQAFGVTAFDRTYNTGQTVTLNAPPSVGNSGFLHWLINGVPYSANPQLTITLNSDMTVTAVYFEQPTHTLNLNSINPNGGVGINVSTPDNNGQQDGSTSFQRIYYEGTNVTVTAPSSYGGVPFRGWLRGSLLMTTNTSYSVTMWSDITLTAWYEDAEADERILVVDSQNPDSGVVISVDQVDNDGEQSGLTDFQREYNFGTSVELSVPPAVGTNVFVRWLRDGIPFSTNNVVNVDMVTDVQMTVVFEPPDPVAVLTVHSDQPDSGVTIEVTEPDNSGLTDGDTTFTRTYNVGTPTELTAPTNAGGNVFVHWTMNGSPVSTDPVIQLNMLSDTELIAVYRPEEPPTPDWELLIESQTPNSGVNITLDNTDLDGLGNGTTSFIRTFEDGTGTSVTAPDTAGGRIFEHWLLDGSPITTNLTTSITMFANHTLTAVYVDPPALHELTVNSLNPNGGVPVACSLDANTNGNGVTTFHRFYEDGESTTLTALPYPPGNPGNTFQQWLRDGAPFSTNLSVTIEMFDDVEMTAQYGPAGPEENRTLTVESINPNTGVAIQIDATDNGGQSDGSTAFSRIYSNGTPVELTAPDIVSGNVFSHWLLDGSQVTTNQSLAVEMLTDVTVTAVYETPYLLNVHSENPNGGVDIVVSTPDIYGGLDGSTEFQRRYLDGTSVSLTAPPLANGNTFLYWESSGNPITTNLTVDITMLGDMHMTAVYESTYNLTVSSIGPDNGVTVGVSTPDVNALADGSTLFVREYESGTDTTLTAPATNHEGRVFQEWLRDGQAYSTNLIVDITMLADVEMTAVYGDYIPEYWLTVRSEPTDNVTIQISPEDNRNATDGETTFARLYDGGTLASATAPPMVGTNQFQQWLLDGTPYSTNTSVTVEMQTHHDLLAVYGPPPPAGENRTLLVDSSNPNSGVFIDVTTPDVEGQTDGDTIFVRTYPFGAVTILTAPAIGGTNGNSFVGWYRGGVLITEDLEVEINMVDDVHMTAVYEQTPAPVVLTVESENPDSGVWVSVSPSDNNSEVGGNTTFNRTYNYGTEVNLVASETAGTNVFGYWLWNNSVVWTTNSNTDVTLYADTTMTAVYGAEPEIPSNVVLTVLAENPDGAAAVSITVTPLDNHGNGNGTTGFTRDYDGGEVVTLTAPQIANGYIFDHWELNGQEVSSELTIVTPPLTSDNTYTAVYEIEEHESGL